MKISAAEIHNAGPKGILWHQILSLVIDDVKKIQAKPITLADKKRLADIPSQAIHLENLLTTDQPPQEHSCQNQLNKPNLRASILDMQLLSQKCHHINSARHYEKKGTKFLPKANCTNRHQELVNT